VKLTTDPAVVPSLKMRRAIRLHGMQGKLYIFIGKVNMELQIDATITVLLISKIS
jgi:hypothetical protein